MTVSPKQIRKPSESGRSVKQSRKRGKTAKERVLARYPKASCALNAIGHAIIKNVKARRWEFLGAEWLTPREAWADAASRLSSRSTGRGK